MAGGERRTIVDAESISYRGLFDPKELYKLVEKLLKDKGYDKRYLANDEFVTETQRTVYTRLKPWKKLSDNEKSELVIDIAFTNLKEEEHEIDGVKIKLYNGAAMIKFWGFLTTDYEGRWDQRPVYFFMRTFVDKFLYKDEVARMEAIVAAHIRELENDLTAFLNMNRWRFQSEKNPASTENYKP